MIRVLLVDDERLVCAHLRTLLSAADDLEVVGEAYDGAEAIEAVVRFRPDVVLMDLRMPDVDGITATARVTALPSPPKVVALTTFDVDDYVLRALQAGAVGFLLKSTAPEDLVALVRVAARGATVLSPEARRHLIEAGADRERARQRVAALTAREREVLAGLGAGLSNQQIARRLHLSEATVKGYVSRLLLELGCDNRTQAGLLAREAGLRG
ncbi:response regulator [Cryptosporangium arvum]|uniref:response regulator n=1 Tax=Cryptosporangium arvum TaxID=80871 RepID=UPI0004BC1225|nr:response regulator transcription factor [Cryptosporangium arvum]